MTRRTRKNQPGASELLATSLEGNPPRRTRRARRKISPPHTPELMGLLELKMFAILFFHHKLVEELAVGDIRAPTVVMLMQELADKIVQVSDLISSVFVDSDEDPDGEWNNRYIA